MKVTEDERRVIRYEFEEIVDLLLDGARRSPSLEQKLNELVETLVSELERLEDDPSTTSSCH